MPIIPIQEIQPGMTLTTDIRDLSGRLLLSGGQIITQKSLRVFKIWGITEAEITPEPTHNPIKTHPTPLAEFEFSNETIDFFRFNDFQNPVIQQLARYYMEHKEIP
ncbi:MAG: hypothetical protein H7832_13475 [Magnetococcus sp. DMHC-6]